MHPRTSARAMMLGAMLALIFPSAPLMAKTVEAQADGREGLRLVIYSAGLGQVDERRQVDLPAGQHELVLSDVSPQLQPETVLLTGPDLSVSAQSFRYDPLSRRRLLEESLGRKVWVRRQGDDDDDDVRLEEGLLLSVAEGPVVRIGERIETVDPGAVVFADLPPDLTARPVLRADVSSANGGERTVRLRYLTNGLAWHADYVATWNPDAGQLDLTGLVSLVNQTGLAFKQAEVLLLAGEVAQAPPPAVPMARQQMVMAADAEMAAAPGVQARGFSDRHLYSLPGTIDLARGETKQVRLFSASEVAVEKRFRLENLIQAGRAPEELGPLHPQILLRLRNETAAGLGQPLPAGRVRIYQPPGSKSEGSQDGDGVIFVGAAAMGHVAEGEWAELSLGEAFDISARAWAGEFKRISTTSGAYETGQRAELVNGGEEAVTVELVGRMPAGWLMLRETASHTKESGNRIRWDIEIPAGGKAAFEYRIRVTP